MDKIKVGVVGLGMMGSLFSRIYQQLPHAQLVAICDRDSKKLKETSAMLTCNPTSFADYREMFAEQSLDAVHIATPDFLHYAPTAAALEAGVNVLVEKPLATSLADGQGIVDLATKCKRRVMVHYSHRWAIPYAAAYQAVQQGKLGDPVMVYARKNDILWVATDMMNWTHRTSSASYLSSHDLDLVLWFLGTRVESVFARGVKKVLSGKGVDTEDAIQALVTFSNGAIGTFESCWVLPNTMPNLTDSYIHLIGSQGTIRLDRGSEGIAIADASSYAVPRLSLTQELPNGIIVGANVRSLEYFINSLLTGETPHPTAEEGLEIVRVCDAIHQSMAEQRVVPLQATAEQSASASV